MQFPSRLIQGQCPGTISIEEWSPLAQVSLSAFPLSRLFDTAGQLEGRVLESEIWLLFEGIAPLEQETRDSARVESLKSCRPNHVPRIVASAWSKKLAACNIAAYGRADRVSEVDWAKRINFSWSLTTS